MNEHEAVMTAQEKGDSDFILDLGASYYNGIEREQDFAKAFEYYSIAAEMGNTTAISNLGYCYLYGRSVPKDNQKALECFETAAAKEDVCAVYKLGDMYYWGNEPVSKDRQKAVQLYQKAFDLAAPDEQDQIDITCFPDICLRIADSIYYGAIRERDLEEALDLYQTAAHFFSIRINQYQDPFTKKLFNRAKTGVTNVEAQLKVQNQNV